MFADTSKYNTTKIKLNVEMNTVMNNVKLNHIIKVQTTDTIKHAGTEQIKKNKIL